MGRLNAYLGARRLAVTCRNGGLHSGYRHLADKDEVPRFKSWQAHQWL
jgi:hypothetical protein